MIKAIPGIEKKCLIGEINSTQNRHAPEDGKEPDFFIRTLSGPRSLNVKLKKPAS